MTLPTFGVDIGGTNLRTAVVDGDGTIADERRVATPALLDDIVAAIAGAIEELAPSRPAARAVGIGAAGMIDFDGVIHYAPNVPAFVRAPLRDLVAKATGRSVVVDNDANVAALAELTHGAGRGYDNLLVITLGTGIGGGVVVGGKLMRGAHGFGAEVGHFQVDPHGPLCMCGEVGHWEAVASGNALGVLGRARAAAGEAPSIAALVGGDVDAIRGVHVGHAAQSGAPDAVALLREYAQQVAVGLVGLANILDPHVILISGGLVELGALLLDPLREWFDGHIEGAPYRAPIEILPAALGEESGVVGAAVLRANPRRVTHVIRLGLTLPSFREDPAPALEVASAAETAGLDGVFAYDHLFRRAQDGSRRPALELLTLMGAVAADTTRIAIGSLVARATLRPPAVLAHGFDTVARIAGAERVIAGIGAGDRESREENESFGLEFGTVAARVAALGDAVDLARDRGYPVWVGGRDPAVREVAAARADGWNRWGPVRDVSRFRAQVADLRAAAVHEPFTVSWGGLVVLGADEREATAKSERLGSGPQVIVGGPQRVADSLRDYVDAGADWLIVGPVDSADPDNARMLGESVLPLLRG